MAKANPNFNLSQELVMELCNVTNFIYVANFVLLVVYFFLTIRRFSQKIFGFGFGFRYTDFWVLVIGLGIYTQPKPKTQKFLGVNVCL